MTYLGIDFGTTNSAIALADDAGAVELLQFTNGESTMRSVLYFGPNRAPPIVGSEAIQAYLGGDGRFIQSIKSHLASRTFTSTQINGRVWTLEKLVTELVNGLLAKANRELPKSVVVGRPVTFVESNPDGDKLAEERLKNAFTSAGFTDVRFTLEPVAAAYGYESRLDNDELVLIADFGGGTTDLCLVDVGPSWRKRAARERVRGSEGIGLAGDAIDQRIIKHAIAPQLGLGTKYKVMGGDADVPLWLYNSLSRWHHLSFLKAPQTMRLLDEILENAHAPDAIEALYRIVDEDLGYALHRAVEAAKVELSHADVTHIDFEDVHCTVKREDLETWIKPDLDAIGGVIDRVLAKTNVSADAVDRVFMTGGTSLVPAVRRLFASRFGEDKLRGGDEMTTVGRGLALAARDAFAS